MEYPIQPLPLLITYSTSPTSLTAATFTFFIFQCSTTFTLGVPTALAAVVTSFHSAVLYLSV